MDRKWLQRSGISRQVAIEALLFAAQEQAIPTNLIKHRIFGQEDVSLLCHLCGLCDETIDHLICSFIAQSAYKHRHDNVTKFLHWKLLDQYQFNINRCWWKHHSESIMENSFSKILWNFTIIADRCSSG